MSTRPPAAFDGLDDLVAHLRGLADAPSGEDDGMSALDHGLQCAYELQQVRPEDLELQVAGLVHDIGHAFGSDAAHGRLGAERVRPLLGVRVAELVEAHVPAKRYLVGAEASYRSLLSETSVATLEAQGGLLTPGEARRFERSPYFRDAVVLRHADDAAKVPGRTVPGLEAWTAPLTAVAR